MTVSLDKKAVETIETILNHGGDVWIYRNKTGIVISEQTRKTKYRTVQRNEQERAIRAASPKQR